MNITYVLAIIYARQRMNTLESASRVREVAGSITDRVIPKTLKMVVMTALRGAHGCVVSITTIGPDWCQDKSYKNVFNQSNNQSIKQSIN